MDITINKKRDSSKYVQQNAYVIDNIILIMFNYKLLLMS